MGFGVVVMGVSGCGKTSVGTALAETLGGQFYDGDDFHPQANVDKMASGTPLNDDDREPWLERLRTLIHDESAAGNLPVVACSALKRKYREHLRRGNDDLVFIFLDGSYNLILDRMEARQDHYMRPEMLQSQFETLEPPGPDEAFAISIDQSVPEIVQQIITKLPHD